MKRGNGYRNGLTDPRKELADSLPLCHPNDDYLKDFTPMSSKTLHISLSLIRCSNVIHSLLIYSVNDDQQPSTSSNVQEGVLTWV